MRIHIYVLICNSRYCKWDYISY